jgi:hypothetical protein
MMFPIAPLDFELSASSEMRFGMPARQRYLNDYQVRMT